MNIEWTEELADAIHRSLKILKPRCRGHAVMVGVGTESNSIQGYIEIVLDDGRSGYLHYQTLIDLVIGAWVTRGNEHGVEFELAAFGSGTFARVIGIHNSWKCCFKHYDQALNYACDIAEAKHWDDSFSASLDHLTEAITKSQEAIHKAATDDIEKLQNAIERLVDLFKKARHG